MTNELEKQFFDTFGIEPREVYPQITDTMLLKLICLWNDNCLYTEDMIAPTNYDSTKECIFNYFIDIKRYIFRIKRKTIKQQVQTLFKDIK